MTGPRPDAAAGCVPGVTRVDAGALLRRAAASAALAGPHLLVRERGTPERLVALADGCTVGRGAAASLRLADPSASRLHLRLHLDEAGASAEDLGSRNGLSVNGRRARGPRRLRSGDELQVGETRLRYVDPLEPAPAPPRGPGAGTAWLAPAGLLLGAAALLLG